MWITGELGLRPVRHADRERGLPEAGGLPAKGLPGQEVHRGGSEGLRGRVRRGAERRLRRPDVEPPAHAATLRAPRRRVALAGGLERPDVPDGAVVRALLRQLRLRQPYGTLTTSRPGFTRTTATASSRARHRHLGGDIWVADAAMAMMENEDWSGMFVTLGGIDKAGHMWGADQDVQPPPAQIDYQTHVQFRPRTPTSSSARSSGQTGGVRPARRDAGRADRRSRRHARRQLLRQEQRQEGATRTGTTASPMNDVRTTNPSPALEPLIATGNVQFSYQSTRSKPGSSTTHGRRARGRAIMKRLPGVIATYWRDGDRYVLKGNEPR